MARVRLLKDIIVQPGRIVPAGTVGEVVELCEGCEDGGCLIVRLANRVRLLVAAEGVERVEAR